MKSKKIGILIPTYNRINKLRVGLEIITQSLKSVDSKNIFEIIVIDDGSTDGTSMFVVQSYPNVVLLNGDGNLWWSGAINVGAKYCVENSYSSILLWNDDIKPSPEYFQNLLTIALNPNQRTIYGSTIHDEKSHKIWFMGAHYFKYLGCIKHIHKKGFLSVNCLTGMGTYVPVEVIKEIGYWDNIRFPQYYGDVDFTLRAFEKGYNIVVEDTLKIENDTSSSSFNQEKSLMKYLRSLHITQSRYNIKKDVMFHRKHALPFVWIIGLILKQIKYIFTIVFNIK